MPYDPRQFIELLRDHLASHDKRLAFLFGAGTSAAVNTAPPAVAGTRRGYQPLIPAILPLTATCAAAVHALSTEHASAWGQLVVECSALDRPTHIEELLSRLRRKLDAMGPTDDVFGLDRTAVELTESTIRATIAAAASPDEETIPAVLPHDAFARWIKEANRRHPVEIFTTNYDILAERSLERARVPVFDGFVGSFEPYFDPDSVNDDTGPAQSWTKVWKIHGSVNWQSRGSTIVRVGAGTNGDMILPSHRKYDESRKLPYLALLDRLGARVAASGALLITCGYSWGDDHVNEVILRALDDHPSSHAIALTFEPLERLPRLVDLAEARTNLIVASPTEHIVGGRRDTWAIPGPLTGAAATFVDLAFDSDAELPDADSGGPTTGRLRLGDFATFCEFLAAMGATSGAFGGS